MSYIIDYYYASNIGKCRHNNQDNFFCNGDFLGYDNSGTDEIRHGRADPKHFPIFSVFDGMGGEERGEIAAYIASESLSTFEFGKNSRQSYTDYCRMTNSLICKYTREHGLFSMGTTMAALRFTKNRIVLCNIGDSKIFHFYDLQLQQISVDHVGIPVFGRKPPLSQNLGIPENELILSPYISIGRYHAGDTYLICSDGLTDMLSNREISNILSEDTDQTAAKRLLEGALAAGGKDNITFILIYIKKRNLFKRKERKKTCQQNNS